jgi:hypothetical protein
MEDIHETGFLKPVCIVRFLPLLAKAAIHSTLFMATGAGQLQDGQKKKNIKKPLRSAAKLKTKPPTLQKAKI